MKTLLSATTVVLTMGTAGTLAMPIYLNESNITVEVGDETSAGSFNNTFSGGSTINKVIDAPTADSEEFHNQTTHIWFTADEIGGGLELLFDFGTEYDIDTLHFWNYTGESFDVDDIAFTFFDSLSAYVGDLSIMPDLGSSPGITAQDIPLAAPLNVQFVTAFLSGSNGQVDFQNIGFSAQLSDPTTPPGPNPTPVPATLALMGLGILLLGRARRKV